MNDFQSRMAAGKQAALEARNQGGSTVRVFASTKAMHAERDPGNEPELFTAFLARAQERATEAVESYRFALFGDDWLDLIPF